MGDGDSQVAAGSVELKPPRPGEESAEVMVTVKTYPNPSDKYLETVCVAGVRLLPVIERDDVVVIGGDDDGSMRTAPLGVLSGAVVVSVTGSSPR